MEKKIYRVISTKGNKTRTIFEGQPFDRTDGDADYAAFLEARRAENKYKMELLTSGKKEDVEIIRENA